ncbi:hypothetical protein BGZ76_007086, partial [Entomortierella beljakovae]
MPGAALFALYMEELILRDEVELDDDGNEEIEEEHADRVAENEDENEFEVEEVEEEDEEEDDLRDEIPQEIIGRNYYPHLRFNPQMYSDDELKTQFRFYRNHLTSIVVELQMPEVIITRKRDKAVSIEAL